MALDGYNLIPTRLIVVAIIAGAGAAALAFFVNPVLQERSGIGWDFYSLYIAPFVEEFLKASYFYFLLRRAKVGFLVDAALYGIAIGAGFALLENIYYLHTFEQEALAGTKILFWIIRGFGTAIMHGGVTAIFAVVTKYLSERKGSISLRTVTGIFGPGFLVAVALHSVFNHEFFHPVIMTLLVLLFFPTIFFFIFQRSQTATREWLRQGMDSDMDMLEVILSSDLGDSRLGQYLQSIQSRFPGQVIGDMLCLVRLNLELSIKAKGVLMMRESGIDLPADPETVSKLKEMEYLEKTIGTVGMLALNPFLPHTTRELWQRNLVTPG